MKTDGNVSLQTPEMVEASEDMKKRMAYEAARRLHAARDRLTKTPCAAYAIIVNEEILDLLGTAETREIRNAIIEVQDWLITQVK